MASNRLPTMRSPPGHGNRIAIFRRWFDAAVQLKIIIDARIQILSTGTSKLCFTRTTCISHQKKHVRTCPNRFRMFVRCSRKIANRPEGARSCRRSNQIWTQSKLPFVEKDAEASREETRCSPDSRYCTAPQSGAKRKTDRRVCFETTGMICSETRFLSSIVAGFFLRTLRMRSTTSV